MCFISLIIKKYSTYYLLLIMILIQTILKICCFCILKLRLSISKYFIRNDIYSFIQSLFAFFTVFNKWTEQQYFNIPVANITASVQLNSCAVLLIANDIVSYDGKNFSVVWKWKEQTKFTLDIQFVLCYNVFV